MNTNKILSKEALDNFELKKTNTRCRLCSNNCELTINSFGENKRRFITGNRCDKPIKKENKVEISNMYEYKRIETFNYNYDENKEYERGIIGIPRVLNIYEHYPFWFNFFDKLDFKVIISPDSTKKIYELGMETIPSDTLCYPAKLVNGHIQYLINQDIKTIFYPSVVYEGSKEKKRGYNCPVVISYPEVIKKNMDSIYENDINLVTPFISFESKKTLYTSLKEWAKEFNINKSELKKAIDFGYAQLEIFNEDILNKTKEIINKVKKENKTAFVLSGRPYHVDKEISHSIDKTITSYGIPVLTEDAVSKLQKEEMKLRVVDQWSYHSRLYKSAEYIGKSEYLELIQLNSFGCGIDAITTDQVKEILEHHNKVYTLLKIDEGENLGAAKIRIRSLSATVKQRENRKIKLNKDIYDYNPVIPKGDLKDYTFLIPQMSPIHFEFVEHALKESGYNFKVLPSVDASDIETGLKTVNNDSCYPAVVVIGQLVKALEKYDLKKDKVALVMSQTGGGCRASNYISLLRKALTSMGYENVPVFSAAMQKDIDVNIVPLNKKTAYKAIMGLTLGDLFLRITHQIRPYEVNPGETDALEKKLKEEAKDSITNASYKSMKKITKKIISEYEKIEVKNFKEKPRVGIVGEILVKYHPSANNQLVKVIEENGGEAVIPDILDFFLYGFESRKFVAKKIYKNFKNQLTFELMIRGLERYRKFLKDEISKSERFDDIHDIKSTANKASELLSLGNSTGEGWFLTGEMINLLEDGVNNIICTQPFGCLPNHITGKGMFKSLKEKYKNANILAVDYDPGASEINQISRIKLMLSVAKRNASK